jgi:hypothetical protein
VEKRWLQCIGINCEHLVQGSSSARKRACIPLSCCNTGPGHGARTGREPIEPFRGGKGVPAIASWYSDGRVRQPLWQVTNIRLHFPTPAIRTGRCDWPDWQPRLPAVSASEFPNGCERSASNCRSFPASGGNGTEGHGLPAGVFQWTERRAGSASSWTGGRYCNHRGCLMPAEPEAPAIRRPHVFVVVDAHLTGRHLPSGSVPCWPGKIAYDFPCAPSGDASITRLSDK